MIYAVTPEAVLGARKTFRANTQTMLPGEDAVLVLLFGLLHSGAITLRRLGGWRDLARPSAPSSALRQRQAA